jgi:hypothetical protein
VYKNHLPKAEGVKKMKKRVDELHKMQFIGDLWTEICLELSNFHRVEERQYANGSDQDGSFLYANILYVQ